MVLGLNYIFLKNNGDFVSVDRVVDLQLETDEKKIFSSSLFQLNRPYKINLYQKVKPDIIVLGSSRTYMMNHSFFSKSFLNLGFGNSLIDMESFVEEILSIHKPELVIWGLNFWWFSDEGKSVNQSRNYSHDLSIHSLFKPTIWLLKNKISFSYYVKCLDFFHNPEKNKAWGVMANMKHFGRLKDGSSYRKNKNYYPRNWASTKNNVPKKQNRFSAQEKINMKKWHFFERILNAFEDANVEVVL